MLESAPVAAFDRGVIDGASDVGTHEIVELLASSKDAQVQVVGRSGRCVRPQLEHAEFLELLQTAETRWEEAEEVHFL